MKAQLWFFIALCLGIFSWYLHRERKYYEDLYSKTYNKLQSKLQSLDSVEGKFHLSQKLMSTLLHPHPESVVLRAFSVEEYRQPVSRYASHYMSYSYTMYGDGRIIYEQINEKKQYGLKAKSI